MSSNKKYEVVNYDYSESNNLKDDNMKELFKEIHKIRRKDKEEKENEKFRFWIKNYRPILGNIENITKNIINNNFPDNRINWDSKIIRNEFFNILYKKSSKTIVDCD